MIACGAEAVAGGIHNSQERGGGAKGAGSLEAEAIEVQVGEEEGDGGGSGGWKCACYDWGSSLDGLIWGTVGVWDKGVDGATDSCSLCGW